MKKFISVFVLMSIIHLAYSQTYQLGFRIGSGIDDAGKAVFTDNNGFVYLSGYFKGTNIDFDPGPGTALLSSNGDKEAFVAKYTVAGQYVWAFKIGGGGLDEAVVTADAAGNVYVTGYFRGSNVDFDPGPGTALLSSNGDLGGDPGYGGDIFLAKYNSSGQYQWAFNIGGTSLGDNGMVLATDNASNIYVAGYFRESPDFDPGSGTAILNGSQGTIFISKYNTNGQYQWAFNLGLGDVDNAPFGMKVDGPGNVYVTGYFQGANRDFNPGAGTALLSSAGGFDAFVGKYNSNGQYQWAFKVGGTGADVGRDIEIDEVGNVYVAGDFAGTNIDFDPSSSSSAPLTANNRDVFIAKYNSIGEYQWAKRFGAAGSDLSWSLAYAAGHLYITGSFQNTINFDPAGIDNLTSNGGNDIYITKFDINGNYVCAFGVGGTGNDDGLKIDADNSGSLYLTGALSSTNTDFNPSTSVVNNLSTAGSSDIYLAKYTWPSNTFASGNLSGNTKYCNSGQGQLTFTATTGNGPFTIQYSVGTNVFTQNNVQSGVPFNVAVNPTTTTTYTLVSVKGSEKCASVGFPSGQTATITVNSGFTPDFNYLQDPCNPKTIQFKNITPGTLTNAHWEFGDNTTNTGSLSPIHTYLNFSSYQVKFRITTTAGCTDSVTKNIPVLLQQDSLINRSDTTICKGGSVQLTTLPTLDFCWGSEPGLNNSNITNPVATPATTTTYYFTAQSTTGNLVVNGDFSAGNSGFTSDYNPQFPNTTEAVYWIGNNPKAWNINFNACIEHTTGTGNMMMVNGSSSIGAKVWSQTVPVAPHTNYAFAVWVQSLAALNPASLKFSINGNVLGNNITAGNTACQWSRFYTTWNSGSNNSAVITIVNNNTVADGNDFAIDDISFSQIFLKQDSIRITVVDTPDVSVTPAVSSICSGTSLPISAAGASNIFWSPAAGLSNPNISNPIATPSVTTKYIATGFNLPGCSGKDSITITVMSTPVVTAINDTGFCEGASPVTIFATAPGTNQYNWTPATGLSNPNISNPVANPSVTTLYHVEVTSVNGCSAIDSVEVAVLPVPTVNTISDATICETDSIALNTTASGATGFTWSPVSGLSNPNIASPVARPNVLTKYIVTASNGICTAKDSVTLTVAPAPMVTTSNDTTICEQGQAQLFATGGITYNWTPATGLNSSAIANPLASPSSATRYYVTVTGANGCSRRDSVNIGWMAKPVFGVTPMSTSVCTGDSALLTASGADTYHWFAGSNILSPNTASTQVIPGNTEQYAVALEHIYCRLKDTITASVTVNSRPVVTASKSNDIDCSNVSAVLTATGGTSYSWFPTIGVSGANTSNPVVTPAVSTIYWVIVTDANGCVNTDSVQVEVAMNAGTGGYFVPTAFTPNNDGQNDCFGLKYWGGILRLDFSVFNRWGERVFYTNDVSRCWDGFYRGIEQPSGTYVYQIKATTACGDIFRKGTLVLIR